MIFFTRRLYQGIQINSGWERRAENEWDRMYDVYLAYEAIIRPLLPKSAQCFARIGLHDAVVVSVNQKSDTISFLFDTRNALGRLRGGFVSLTFTGVKHKIKTRGLVGQWWLYSEFHLSSCARFSLHILFDEKEIEIEADDMLVKKVKGNQYSKK